MDRIDEWHEHRTKIPPGRYELYCIKAAKAEIWHEGKGGWGKSGKMLLWFEVFQGEHTGKLLPMFLTLGGNGKIPQGSKYFVSWCIANGLRRPARGRLKEMGPSKFLNKIFEGEVVDVKPRWHNGREQPDLFHYSRVDVLYELLAGNPDNKGQ
jgi:hypothetical protein